MSGVKYLLDTNFILGMLKTVPEVSEVLVNKQITAGECAYSAVTRMVLLGFQGITPDEDALLRARLGKFHYLAIDLAVEDHAINSVAHAA
jgi:hypothetical protein